MRDTTGFKMTNGKGRMEILLEVANADLYRLNGFRLVELAVDATPREILRQSERLKIMEKLGMPCQGNGPLPLNPLPGIDEMQEALQRLHDPERRLFDEFFWFWPLRLGQGDKDEALYALSRNDIKSAVTIWLRFEKSQNDTGIPKHNLAILNHALALDIEYKALTCPLPENQKMVRDNYWAEAYKLWEIALEHEGVWDRLNVRIHDLKDPRLTTDFANSIRNTLPLFILLINAKLALRAAENNNKKEAKRHLEIMKRWRAGKTNSQTEQVTEALQIAVKPLNERIKLLSRHPVDECENNPANADKILLQFVDQAKKLLAILDILLPADHPTRNASHDQVALAALQCQVIYTNNTKNWERSLTLIDQFYPIAVSEFAKSQIKESRDTVETTWQLKQWR